MIEVKRKDKVEICDKCGKKIEAKVPRWILTPPLNYRKLTICYPCAEELILNHFIK